MPQEANLCRLHHSGSLATSLSLGLGQGEAGGTSKKSKDRKRKKCSLLLDQGLTVAPVEWPVSHCVTAVTDSVRMPFCLPLQGRFFKN